MRYRQLLPDLLDFLYLDFPKNLESSRKAMVDPKPPWRELYQAALLELDRDAAGVHRTR